MTERIVTKLPTNEYRTNFDRIFRKKDDNELGKELFLLSAKGYTTTNPWETLSKETQQYYIDSARIRHEYNKDLDGGCRDINLYEGESLLPEKHTCEYRCKD